MKLNNLGANKTEVQLNGNTIFFSYKTPVAAHIDGEGFYRTSERFSVTTSKHINQWLAGAKAKEMPQDFFNGLV